MPSQRRATELDKKMLRWAQTANLRFIYYTVGQQKWCMRFVRHKRELLCFVLGNLLPEGSCSEFKTGKSSSNYSAWKEIGADLIEAPTQPWSGWQDTVSLYKPGFTCTRESSQLQKDEYCSFCQGASSSSRARWCPFPQWQETWEYPETASKRLSVHQCQTLHFQKPRWGLWSQMLKPGHMLVSICSLSVFEKCRRHCANLCCFVAKGNMGTFAHHFTGAQVVSF